MSLYLKVHANPDVPASLQYGREKMRIVYSRDFLLSFGELEHCKKLPPGVDTALLRSSPEPAVYWFASSSFFACPSSFEWWTDSWYLFLLALSNSELQELSAGVLERNKGYYHTTLGRSDGSSSYTYSSRGGNSGGRWDTRSTGSSDRDGELPDREPLTQGMLVPFWEVYYYYFMC
jgi:hypothetical protein